MSDNKYNQTGKRTDHASCCEARYLTRSDGSVWAFKATVTCRGTRS